MVDSGTVEFNSALQLGRVALSLFQLDSEAVLLIFVFVGKPSTSCSSSDKGNKRFMLRNC